MKKTYYRPELNCFELLSEDVMTASPRKNELEEDWN